MAIGLVIARVVLVALFFWVALVVGKRRGLRIGYSRGLQSGLAAAELIWRARCADQVAMAQLIHLREVVAPASPEGPELLEALKRFASKTMDLASRQEALRELHEAAAAVRGNISGTDAAYDAAVIRLSHAAEAILRSRVA